MIQNELLKSRKSRKSTSFFVVLLSTHTHRCHPLRRSVVEKLLIVVLVLVLVAVVVVQVTRPVLAMESESYLVVQAPSTDSVVGVSCSATSTDIIVSYLHQGIKIVQVCRTSHSHCLLSSISDPRSCGRSKRATTSIAGLSSPIPKWFNRQFKQPTTCMASSPPPRRRRLLRSSHGPVKPRTLPNSSKSR
jgi:hypothetical protein